eukprot:514125_1
MRTRHNIKKVAIKTNSTTPKWVLLFAALMIVFTLLLGYSYIRLTTYHETLKPHKKIDIAKPDPELERIDYGNNPIKEESWGNIYTPSRIWCLVPTLYPRNSKNMHAISQTWGRHCTKVIFVLDDKLPIPKDLYIELNQHANNVELLQLTNLQFPQSSTKRNIWDKVWKMWYYIYYYHINDAEWFLKIDDDTFFSPIQFHGMAQYFNPDNSSYYIGHTLFHEWLRRNIIFNAGACYGLSRGVLRKFAEEILSLSSFRNDDERNHDEYYPYKDESKKRLKWEWRDYCVGNREFAQEDPTMGICLRSIGINPINTLDRQFRQRFHIFRPTDLKKIKREDTWFWRYKDNRIGDGDNCCSDYSISFHSYKVDAKDTLKNLKHLDEEYNVKNLKKEYELPWDDKPSLFLWDKETAPEHDQYFNYLKPPHGQRIYKGVNNTRYCNQCDWFRVKK